MNPTRRRHLQFVIAITCITTAFCTGLLLLLNMLLQQAGPINLAARLSTDPIIQQAFYLEREFLLFRNELRMAAENPIYQDWNELERRRNAFSSRLRLLNGNPNLKDVRQRDEFKELIEQLDSLADRSKTLIEHAQPSTPALRTLLTEMLGLKDRVLALSTNAGEAIDKVMDDQMRAVRTQSQVNVALIATLLIISITGAVLLCRHNSRQLQEEQVLNQRNMELFDAQHKNEEASKSKSRFLANMSHELRTPFNGLLGMLTLLESSPLNTDQRTHITIAKESAQHLLTLLNDVLDISAVEAGKMTLAPTPTHFPQLLEQVQVMVNTLAEEKGLALHVQHDTQLPEWICIDATRLRQILYNLLGNAIKFTEKGHVGLLVSATPLEPEANQPSRQRVVLQVSDTGIGIASQDQVHLFDRFYQVDNSPTRPFSGRGLGLDISRTLARLMGGDIAVKSVLDAGSTFTLTMDIPLCDAPPLQANITDKPGRPLRVLVAEDQPINRKLVGTLLEKMGHTVLFATNGREALAQASTEKPDLVLMDVQMPEMDGLTSTRHIRALLGSTGRVPVIALTANVMSDARVKALEAGANDFLAKPVQPEQLRQAIAHWGYQPQTT